MRFGHFVLAATLALYAATCHNTSQLSFKTNQEVTLSTSKQDFLNVRKRIIREGQVFSSCNADMYVLPVTRLESKLNYYELSVSTDRSRINISFYDLEGQQPVGSDAYVLSLNKDRVEILKEYELDTRKMNWPELILMKQRLETVSQSCDDAEIDLAMSYFLQKPDTKDKEKIEHLLNYLNGKILI